MWGCFYQQIADQHMRAKKLWHMTDSTWFWNIPQDLTRMRKSRPDPHFPSIHSFALHSQQRLHFHRKPLSYLFWASGSRMEEPSPVSIASSAAILPSAHRVSQSRASRGRQNAAGAHNQEMLLGSHQLLTWPYLSWAEAQIDKWIPLWAQQEWSQALWNGILVHMNLANLPTCSNLLCLLKSFVFVINICCIRVLH